MHYTKIKANLLSKGFYRINMGSKSGWRLC